LAWQGLAWNLLSQKHQKNRGFKHYKYVKKDLYSLVQMAIFVKDKILEGHLSLSEIPRSSGFPLSYLSCYPKGRAFPIVTLVITVLRIL
jgi:hypothetical protein